MNKINASLVDLLQKKHENLNIEFAWALVQMLDGLRCRDLPDQLGLSDEDCCRIWMAGIKAKSLLDTSSQLAAEILIKSDELKND